MIRCRAVKFIQNKRIYYMCLIKAKELLSDYAVDVYVPVAHEEGYQRNVQMGRARKFADYLLNCGGAFNSTCLLNIREANACKFIPDKSTDKDLATGDLEINKSLYIVDGQHRIKGLEIAIKEGYDKESFVPVVISQGNKKHEEALLFLIVNRTAKGIRADLTDELIYRTIHPSELTDDLKGVLNLTVERNIGEFARDVARKMNDDSESLWYNRMLLPNEKQSGDKTVSLRIFAQYLTEAINSCSLLKKAFNLGDMDSIIKWLKDYWEAIRNICPRATSSEWSRYTLLRTSGVSTMNKLFGRILDDVGGEYTITKFANSLEKITSFDDQSWHSKEGEFGKLGTSKKNLTKIYSTMEYELDTSTLG